MRGVNWISPSYRRADQAKVHEYLPVSYVVSKEEAPAYRKLGAKVRVLPNGVQGNISRVRNWILDNCGDRIVMVDDDLRALGKWEEAQAKRLSTDEAVEFIDHGFALCEQLGAALWGLNLIPDKSSYREYTPFCLRSPILGPFSAHLKNPCRYDTRLSLKEDYDMFLQVLNRFRITLRFNAYWYECAQHTNEGGCASYRTVSRERKQFELLQRKWGDKIVSVDSGKRHVAAKKSQGYDLNPVIKAPIAGV